MAASNPNRRQSTRQARTATTRPLNYYARGFGGPSTAAGVGGPADPALANPTPPGFFPAITHFTDSVDALPQEMIRHFSMLKEVEAKLHLPDEELRRVTDAITSLPPPPRNLAPANAGRFPGLSMQNSVRNGSVRSVSATSAAHGLQAGDTFQQQQSLNGLFAEPILIDPAAIERQQLFTQLKYTIMAMAPMLDEKNAVLSTANQTLKGQLERMESSYKYVDDEISAEARYGSRQHWAYVTEKEPVKKPGPERTRRDNAGTNNHFNNAAADDMAARSEARREAVKEAKAKKRAAQQAQADSDFDDVPTTKKGGKGRKPAIADADPNKNLGLGISNGAGAANGVPQSKKRKAPGGAQAGGAPAMERQMSGTMRGAFAQNARDTPGSDVGPKRRVKATPTAPPKKRQPALPRSPQITSSPVVGAFATRDASPKASATRNPHTTSNPLPPSLLSEAPLVRPPSVEPNKEANPTDVVSEAKDTQAIPEAPSNGTTEELVQVTEDSAPKEDTINSIPEALDLDQPKEEKLDEDVIMADVETPTSTAPGAARSGRTSKVATPLTGTFPSLSRNKSRNKGEAGGSGDTSHASSDSGHPERNPRKKGRHGSTSAASLFTEATGSRKGTPKPATPGGSANEPDTENQEKEEPRGRPEPIALPSLNGKKEDLTSNGHEKPHSQVHTPTVSTRATSRPNTPRDDFEIPAALRDHNKAPIHKSDEKSGRERAGSRPSTSTGKSSRDGHAAKSSHGKNSASKMGGAKSHRNSSAKHMSTSSLGKEIANHEDFDLPIAAAAASGTTEPTKGQPSITKEPEINKSKRADKNTGSGANPGSGSGKLPSRPQDDVPPDAGGDDPDLDAGPPTSPSEPTYCYCNDVSYGEMIACDQPDCPREWFHLKCTDLDEVPGEDTTWLCELCKGRKSETKPRNKHR